MADSGASSPVKRTAGETDDAPEAKRQRIEADSGTDLSAADDGEGDDVTSDGGDDNAPPARKAPVGLAPRIARKSPADSASDDDNDNDDDNDDAGDYDDDDNDGDDNDGDDYGDDDDDDDNDGDDDDNGGDDDDNGGDDDEDDGGDDSDDDGGGNGVQPPPAFARYLLGDFTYEEAIAMRDAMVDDNGPILSLTLPGDNETGGIAEAMSGLDEEGFNNFYALVPDLIALDRSTYWEAGASSDAEFQAIGFNCPKLVELTVGFRYVYEADIFEAIAKYIPSITSLIVVECRLSSENLAHIGSMTQLEALELPDIDHIEVPDEIDLEAEIISGLPNLRTFNGEPVPREAGG